MNNVQKEKLNFVLNNNNTLPIIIEGAKASDFLCSVVIDAKIDSAELGVSICNGVQKLPSWLLNINRIASQNQMAYIVVDGIEKTDKQEQEKFLGMLNYKGINGYSFPQNTQIIFPVKKGKTNNISQKITALCLIYKVN